MKHGLKATRKSSIPKRVRSRINKMNFFGQWAHDWQVTEIYSSASPIASTNPHTFSCHCEWSTDWRQLAKAPYLNAASARSRPHVSQYSMRQECAWECWSFYFWLRKASNLIIYTVFKPFSSSSIRKTKYYPEVEATHIITRLWAPCSLAQSQNEKSRHAATHRIASAAWLAGNRNLFICISDCIY